MEQVQRRYFDRYTRFDAVLNGSDEAFTAHVDNLQCQVPEERRGDNLAMLYDVLFPLESLAVLVLTCWPALAQGDQHLSG